MHELLLASLVELEFAQDGGRVHANGRVVGRPASARVRGAREAPHVRRRPGALEARSCLALTLGLKCRGRRWKRALRYAELRCAARVRVLQ